MRRVTRRAPGGVERAPAVDPWAVLRQIQRLPLLSATRGDDDINGGDAVDELAVIRQIVDQAIQNRRRG